MFVEVATCVSVPRRVEWLYSAEVLKAVAVAAVEPPPPMPPPPPHLSQSHRVTKSSGRLHTAIVSSVSWAALDWKWSKVKRHQSNMVDGHSFGLADSHQTNSSDDLFAFAIGQTSTKIAYQHLFLLLSAASEAIKWQQTRIWTSVWLAQGEVCSVQ